MQVHVCVSNVSVCNSAMNKWLLKCYRHRTNGMKVLMFMPVRVRIGLPVVIHEIGLTILAPLAPSIFVIIILSTSHKDIIPLGPL